MDELKKLYDALSRGGQYTKSFEEFQVKWGDDAYKDKVYSVVSKEGLYTKDKNSFISKYGSPVKKKVETDVTASTQETTNTTSEGDPQKSVQSGGISGSSVPGIKSWSDIATKKTTDQLSQAPRAAVKETVKTKAADFIPKEQKFEYEAAPKKETVKTKAADFIPKEQKFDYEATPEKEDIGPVSKAEVQRQKDFSELVIAEPGSKEQAAIIEKKTAEKEQEDIEKNEYLSVISGNIMTGSEEDAVKTLREKYGKFGFTFEEKGIGDAIRVTSKYGDPIEIDLDISEVIPVRFNPQATALKDYLWKNKSNTNESSLVEVLKTMRTQPGAVSEKMYSNVSKGIDSQITELSQVQIKLAANIKSFETAAKENGTLTPEQHKEYTEMLKEYNKGIPEARKLESLRKEINTSAGIGLKQVVARNEKLGTTAGALGNMTLKGIESIVSGATTLGYTLVDVVDEAVSLAKYTQGYEEMFGKSDDVVEMSKTYQDLSKRSDFRKEAIKKNRDKIKGALVAELGSTTSKEYVESEDRGLLMKAAMGVAESAPAMLIASTGVGFAAMALQSFDAVAEEWVDNPEYEDMPLSDLLVVGGSIAIIQGALENFGLTSILSDNPAGKTFINKVLKNTFGKVAGKTSGEAFNKLIAAETNSLIKNGVVKIIGGGLVEGETGALQEIADIGIKSVYNKLEGKEIFDTPETFGEAVSQVSEAAKMEAIGGMLMKGAMSAPKIINDGMRKSEMEAPLVEALHYMSESPELRRSMVKTLKMEVINKKMTLDEAKSKLADFETMTTTMREIPMDIADKSAAFDLIIERNRIEKEIEGKDAALVADKKNRITEINTELTGLTGVKEEVPVSNVKPVKYSSTEVERVKTLPKESEDGATMNLDGTKYEGGGLVIPLASKNMDASELTQEVIDEFIAENKESINDKSLSVKVGIYKFPNSNQVSVDLNIVADPSMREEALAIGKELGQESLFDLDTFENIKTGADGKNPKILTPKEFKDIQKRLIKKTSKGGVKPSGKPKSSVNEASTQQATTETLKEQFKGAKTEREQKVIRAANSVVKSLSGIPGVKVFVHNTTDAYNSAIAKTTGESKESIDAETQKSLGEYISGAREIHINLENESTDATTVYHEAFHAVFEAKGIESGAAKEMVDGLKKIVKDKKLLARIDNFVSSYESGEQSEEFMAETVGILSEAAKTLDANGLHRLINLINKIANKILGKPLFKTTASRQEVLDFINKTSSSLRTGVEVDINTPGGESETGTFNIPSSRKMKKAPSSKDDSRDFIRKFVEDIDLREFNGQNFITNMYDYTGAGTVDLGNGNEINLLGGKNYVPYMMDKNGKKMGDVSNLAAFNSKAQAETFVRNSIEGNASLFAPHSGTLSNSWQFQQHTFSELTNLILDNGILTSKGLISTFNDAIKNNAQSKKAFKDFATKHGENIKNFSSFASDPKKIVDLLDIVNNYSPDLRKILNNAISSNKTFQEAIGVKNKNDFYNKIMDPMNNGVVGGEIIGVVSFDPSTFEIVQTKNTETMHHPSFGWTLLAKINGIYQPTEFHKSSNITEEYTKYNKGGKKVSRKSEDTKFEEKNVSSSAGAIPKVAKVEVSPVRKKQIIGENAELSKNVRDNLSVARDMAKVKESPKKIRLATGWERGADGKWRYEINDIDLDKIKYDTQQTIGDVLEGQELLKLYPSLKDVTVKFTKGNNSLIGRLLGEKKGTGFYSMNAIGISANKKENAYNVLIHEIQHAIQNIEGFSRGSSPETINESTGKRMGGDGYRKKAGEVEARNVQARIGMTPKKRRETLLQETEDVAREDQIFFISDSKSTSRKKRVISKEESAKLTEDKDGNYYFENFGFSEKSALKPSLSTGAGLQTSKEERAAINSVGGLTMLYSMEGQTEMGVGNVKHKVLVPKEEVYHVQEDVNNYYEEAKKQFNEARPGLAFDPNYQAAWITKVANDNGYTLAVTKWRGTELRAQTTLDLTPTETDATFKGVVEDQYNVGDEINVRGDDVIITELNGDIATYKGSGTSGTVNLKTNKRNIRKKRIFRRPNEINVLVQNGKDSGMTDSEVKAELKNSFYTDREIRDAMREYHIKDQGIWIKKSDNKAVEWVLTWRRRMLSAKKMMPKLMHHLVEDMDAEITATYQEINQNVKDFNIYYDRQKGTKEEKELLLKNFDAYIRGDQTVNLPDDLLNVADTLRKHIDALSQSLIDSGTVDEYQAVKITDNIGHYLTRSYEIYTNSNWKSKVDKKIVQQAKNYLKSDKRLNKKAEKRAVKNDMSFDEALDLEVDLEVDRLLTKDGAENFMQGANLGSKNTSILKQQKDIPVEIRMLLGEHSDPMLNYANTARKIVELQAKDKYLKDLREAGLGIFLFEEADKTMDFNVKITDSENMSPLNGLYTTQEIADAIKNKKEDAGRLVNYYMKMISLVKWMKTIGSVATHGKNVVGNTPFMIVNGHYRVNEIRESYKTVKEDFMPHGTYLGRGRRKLFGQDTKKVNTAARERMSRYIKLGIVKQSAGLGELMDMFKGANWDTSLASRLNGGRLGIFSRGKRKVLQARKGLENLYQAEDDFFKIIAYENELSRYSKAMFGKNKKDLTKAEQDAVDNEIVEIVKNTMPTYSRVGEIVNKINRFPLIGNFISFQYESYRTAGATSIIAYKELTSKNKEIKMIGAQRLIGTTSYLTAKTILLGTFGKMTGVGLSGIVGAILNRDDEDEKNKDIRRWIPTWSKKSQLLIMKASDGKIRYIDLSSSDPHGGFQKVMNAALLGDDSISGDNRFFSMASEFLEPFIGVDITTNALASLYSNTDAYGRQIYNPADSYEDKRLAQLEFMWKLVRPGTVTSYNRVEEAEDPLSEVLSAITGLRIMEFPVIDQAGYNMIHLNEMAGYAKDDYNSAYRKFEKGDITKEELDKAYNKSNVKVKEFYNDIIEEYNAAKKFGVKEEDLQKKLDDIGIAKYRRIEIQKNKIEDMHDKDYKAPSSGSRKRKKLY